MVGEIRSVDGFVRPVAGQALGVMQARARPVARCDADTSRGQGIDRSGDASASSAEGLGDATLASVTRAGRVAFEAEFRERRDLRELRDFYVREAEASTSQAFLGALMSIYLGSYEPGGRHTRDLAAALDVSRDRLGRRWSALLQNVQFLFDSRNAARLVRGRDVQDGRALVRAGEARIP